MLVFGVIFFRIFSIPYEAPRSSVDTSTTSTPNTLKEAGKEQHQTASPAPQVTDSVRVPQYEIVSREYANRTALVWHVIISGTITEAGIQQLLRSLLHDADAIRGSQFHGGRPSAIVIWLYTSREHFDSGMGQWIAKIRRASIDGPVEQKVKSELISQLTAEPETMYGLSESERLKAFRAITIAQDRARHEAWQRYPLRGDPLADPKNFNPNGDERAQLKMESKLCNRLREQYVSEVARRFGLTEDQCADISVEGLQKNWPFPEYSRRDALQDSKYFQRLLDQERIDKKPAAKVQKPAKLKVPANAEVIAAAKLELALALLRQNKADKFKQRLQAIVDEYPDTDAGKAAAKMLEEKKAAIRNATP